MKLNRNLKLLTSLVLMIPFFALFATSCSDDDSTLPPPSSYTIAQHLSSGTTVTLFTEALDRIDFLDDLGSTKKHTVFAPHDDAFEEFLEDNDYEDVDDIPSAELKKLVLNHIIPANDLFVDDLLDMDKEYVESSAEYSLFISIDDEDVRINNNSTVDDEVFDVTASNGVIHLVNDLITLPTIATFLEIDSDLSDFHESLTDATPDEDFINMLSSLETDDDTNAPFTVFAPINDAFEALLDTNDDWDSIEDIEKSRLTSILKHHIIVATPIEKDDMTDGQTIETLEGDNLTFTESEGEFTITDGADNNGIEFLFYDIKTQNGTIHFITSVLMPNTEN